MQRLISKLKEPWGFYRWLRLGLGIYFIYEALNRDHVLAGAFGVLLLIQTAINAKCLPCEMTGACTPTQKNSNSNSDKEIEFEEIK